MTLLADMLSTLFERRAMPWRAGRAGRADARPLPELAADLLRLGRDDPALQALDLDFRHLFTSWVNRGFLVLRPIGRDSPAAVLDRIVAHEAVHAIRSRDDLRGRVETADRRCFAFFHPAMPDAPLIFVEVALTRGVPGSIEALLAADRAILPAERADTAAFYAISTCQAGLAGISFGSSLIKQVAADLALELPGLRTFATLSPLPGFAAWPEEEQRAPADDAALRALAARDLTAAKRGDGQPLDPVARFHLGNGVMVSYLHDPGRLAQNPERYAEARAIATSGEVRAPDAAADKVLAGREPAG